MKDLIAYCGLDCETCEARLATVNGDEALRRRVAGGWSELNGVEITPEMIHCVGCRVDGVKTPYCESLCPIRQCALGRGVETCGACGAADACEKLGAITGNNPDAAWNLKDYDLVTLRQRPALLDRAADWFHERWGVPREAYLERMAAYLDGDTEYAWVLCLHGEDIVGGLGVIDNDFHDRKDLAPNVCAVYTEKAHRGQGIAGRMLDFIVEELRARGVSPLYLVTDHVGFYERYGWEYLCAAREDGGTNATRVYMHR